MINSTLIDSDNQTLLSKLEKFEAPYLEEKLLNEGKFENRKDYQDAFKEFKRFVFLTQLTDEGLGMSSEAVDNVWHQFILFTPQYHEFCNEFLGAYLHHLPKSSFFPMNDSGKSPFVSLYQEVFGDVPSIWSCMDDKCNSCKSDQKCNSCKSNHKCNSCKSNSKCNSCKSN